MSPTNPKVDGYLRKATTWRDELTALRQIILSCGLTEEVKWRVPCYTFQNHNIVLINRLKESCAIGFVKGALLNDGAGVLAKPGENTQAARVIKFTSVREIKKMRPVLKDLIRQAVEVEKAGLKVEPKKKPEPIPDELQKRRDEDTAFNTAFTALTPGRRRAYVLHFSAPKQSKTREARINKCRPLILAGKGLTDDYIKQRK